MSELIYNDFEYQVFYDIYTQKFYIEKNGIFLEKININEYTNLINYNISINDIIKKVILNLYNKCIYCNKYCDKNELYCDDKCKLEHKYQLRRHQEAELGDLILAIKERVFNCEYCNLPLDKENKQADHIFPLKNYGDNYYDNIAIVCNSCNASKYNKDLLEWAEDKGLKLPKNIINHYYWLLKKKK